MRTHSNLRIVEIILRPGWTEQVSQGDDVVGDERCVVHAENRSATNESDEWSG